MSKIVFLIVLTVSLCLDAVVRMDPCSEEEGILREWAPLSALLTQIPPKAQRGLFTGDLSLTCIAALPEHLAIGTNHGLVYWYNRVTNELQRLRCEV